MTFIASAHTTSGQGLAQHLQLGRHELVADEPKARGGADEGPAPFALVLAGLGACTAITLEMYAQRKGWALGVVRVDLRLFEESGPRAEPAGEHEGGAAVAPARTPPEGRPYRIERVLRVEGALADEQRARLLEIAGKTPVTKALLPAFVIETTFASP